jgi:hypothetical protein
MRAGSGDQGSTLPATGGGGIPPAVAGSVLIAAALGFVRHGAHLVT